MAGDQKGFTLIELLIVVAIIGLLAAIAMPNLMNALQRAKQAKTVADMREIGAALEKYAVDNNTYPHGLTDAGAAEVSTFLSPLYLRAVPPGDGWKNRWHIDTTSNGTTFTITSYGRDGISGPQNGGPVTGLDCDIVFSNMSFYQWPEGAQQ
ncbi:MAG TPA: type II secretion system protein GspG [Candidatus Polarisedimenticolia bacterium]|nr:type II secretion system protein GspG [Candidatus Polarisedimenticolia bacterium]